MSPASVPWDLFFQAEIRESLWFLSPAPRREFATDRVVLGVEITRPRTSATVISVFSSSILMRSSRWCVAHFPRSQLPSLLELKAQWVTFKEIY